MNPQVQEFDQFFKSNYKYLCGFSRSIDVKNDYESLLHDSYLRCRDRIAKNGYQGKDYLNYTMVTIMNLYKTQYTQSRNYQKIEFENPDYQSNIEYQLQLKESQEQQEQELYYRAIFLNTMVFEYLDRYCTPREIFIFKTYFLLKHKRLNYEQLSQATNLSVKTVSTTIKKVKKELQRNIISYINTGMSMEELITSVETLLKTRSITRNWQEFVDMYFRITGQRWVGCKCKAQKLYDWLNDWVKNNKK